MRDLEAPKQRKPIEWMGDSQKRLRKFPDLVKKELGFGLYEAQRGAWHVSAKPLHGELTGVMEIGADDESGTYRAVYTVKFEEAVYVLHCFQKKSKKGIATPKTDLELISKRLKEAKEHHKTMVGGQGR